MWYSHFGPGNFGEYLAESIEEKKLEGAEKIAWLSKVRLFRMSTIVYAPPSGSVPRGSGCADVQAAFGDRGIRRKLPGLPEMTDFETRKSVRHRLQLLPLQLRASCELLEHG
jgi:hypothetical protein